MDPKFLMKSKGNGETFSQVAEGDDNLNGDNLEDDDIFATQAAKVQESSKTPIS